MRLPILFIALLLSACATPPGGVPASAGKVVGLDGPAQWWRIEFPIAWDAESEPQWHYDAFIAHRLVGPPLRQQLPRIPLWRFHRRAAPDQAGHRFTLLLYTDQPTVERVMDAIRRDPDLAMLVESAVVREVIIRSGGERDPGGTSDPVWAEELQQAWPWFVMGVSRSWLELIERVAAEQPATEPVAIDARYRAINERVQELWETEGGHAYLHHLNALFGYRGVMVVERRLLRF